MKRWYFPLRRIAQGNNHGCGIAAVAIACGVTYERARSEFFPRRRRFNDNSTLHVSPQQMATGIRRLGFSAVARNTFRQSECPVLVPFAWQPNYEHSLVHCVVWDPWTKRFVDPGYDHDRNLPNKFYIDLWERSNFKVLAVTAKRH